MKSITIYRRYRTVMLIALALAVGLFHHHKQQPKQDQTTPAAVTQETSSAFDQEDYDAQMYESRVTAFVAHVKAVSPNVPALYYEAVAVDLYKLSQEHAGDASFEEDLSNLEGDVQSLGFAAKLYENLDNA